MKKVLITGGSGLLGAYLQKEKPDGYELYPTYFNGTPQWRQLDITNKLSIYRLFSDFKFDVIIHTAGLGNVDFCEQVPHISDLVNYEGTKNLIDILNELKHKPLFIQISSNAIYDGDHPPYSESSPRNPINKYGFNNKLADEYTQWRYDNWLIIRPFMLFGWSGRTNRRNWLEVLVNALDTNTKMKLIDNIYWQPTSVQWAAQVIYSLIDKELSNEEINLSQGETMSLYGFACKVADAYGRSCDLFEPVLDSEFVTLAKRPKDTSYDISKLKSIIGSIPTVEDELRCYLKP